MAHRALGKAGNYISTRIGRAIQDYNMIEEGDRILVGVSGGKDSYALLKLLNERKRWAPVSYELIAIHVEAFGGCVGKSIKKSLIKSFEDIKIPYVFETVKLGRRKEDKNCFWCSWNRRKALFLAADRLKCNKVALGHHADDIIETLLLNLFYQGEFAGMNPRQELFGGKLVIIRPLCHVEERMTRAYARETGMRTTACACPNAETSKRRVMKRFIAKLEKGCPQVKTNLFRSMARIKSEYLQIKDTEERG